jgi:organic hydroperoxide reductase OsmC/OhrA
MAMSPLIDCGKPLFFKVADPDRLGLAASPVRMGQAVRAAVRSLSLMQKEALVVSSRSGTVWRLASDEGAYLEGDDVAPCPLAFFTTGMVAATMSELLALAKRRQVKLGGLRLIQDNFYTMEGSALQGTMTGGALPVELAAEISGDADRDRLCGLLQEALAASPVSGLLRGVHESLFTLTLNGAEVEPERVHRIGRLAEPDPTKMFERAEPAAGDWDGLVARAGTTPQTEEATSSSGSSYQDQQSRRLHVRGICSLRPDGIKTIEQHLYNPLGSIFRFLSDEGAPDGQGRAPDALSYLAAGIAFCFMTQLGRYAKIAKRRLDDYRVVQDMHFSLGGASGGSARQGEANAVETHVHLRTPEDAGFARKVLDMGEQTCFLHALCRTDLETRIRIRDATSEAA